MKNAVSNQGSLVIVSGQDSRSDPCISSVCNCHHDYYFELLGEEERDGQSITRCSTAHHGDFRTVPRGDVHVNTAESSHALIRRGLIGIYHNVSREYLHRYLWQFDFLWNNRQLNDGERTILAVKAAEGKRLMYKDPVAEREYIKTREEEKGGEQLEPF
jgi:hypothetical protein